MSTETITVERSGRVGVIRLNRPQALNALNATLKDELLAAAEAFDADAGIGCIVITGSDKAFAAGADIKEMADQSYIDVFGADYAADYERLTRIRKPIIAAVAGFALGGGCEVAMMCDLIIAADNARFGQPEIKLGVIPGMGGTQRLTRAVGKAKAMDLILTGRGVSGDEAQRMGLANRLVEPGTALAHATELARQLAAFPQRCLRSDRLSSYRQWDLGLEPALELETRMGLDVIRSGETQAGASRFAGGAGRHGEFE